MPSPFPGMDPYLEAHWRDVHASLVIYARDALQLCLPADLRARVEERVFVESPTGIERAVYPDVRVVERPTTPTGTPRAVGGRAVAEPLLIHVSDEPVTETFLEIREAGSGGRVITIIEIVSSANKRAGEGRELYRRKQREVLAAGVSLVEIDLLRAGQRVLAIPTDSIPPSHRTDYQICVSRGWRRSTVEVYRASLREPLPVIAVPLRENDDDAVLDVQALIDRCYAGGSYDDLDYATEPEPPLARADASWADAILRERGLRSTTS